MRAHGTVTNAGSCAATKETIGVFWQLRAQLQSHARGHAITNGNAAVARRSEDAMARIRPEGWFDEYRCGCVSEVVRFKRELTGYCGKHGDNRRHVYRL